MLVKTQKCLVCEEVGEVDVPSNAWAAYKSGMFIQDAMPTVPAPIREQIISGTHPECWDKMWADFEED